MNNFKTDINGGLPFRLDDLRFMTAAQMEAFKGLVQSLIGDLPYAILNGCEDSIIGDTWHLTEGYVYFDGEIFYAPSQDLASITTGGYFWEVNITYDHSGDKVFNDSVVNSTYQIRQAHCVFKDAGTEGTMPPMLMDNTVTILKSRLGVNDTVYSHYNVNLTSANVTSDTLTLSSITGTLEYNIIGNIIMIGFALNISIDTVDTTPASFYINLPPNIIAASETGTIVPITMYQFVDNYGVYFCKVSGSQLKITPERTDNFASGAQFYQGQIFFEIE